MTGKRELRKKASWEEGNQIVSYLELCSFVVGCSVCLFFHNRFFWVSIKEILCFHVLMPTPISPECTGIPRVLMLQSQCKVVVLYL